MNASPSAPKNAAQSLPNMTPTPIDDPAHWRQLAEEARRMADQLADPETKQMMLEIAASYEELAGIAEARAKG